VSTKPDIAQNLATVKAKIGAAAAAAGRDAGAVTLVCVSKTFPSGRIREALDAGQRTFGENRFQEAEDKWPALKEACPGARLHFIGHLQRNKVKGAVRLCDAIETVDNPRLAQALATEMDRTGLRPDVFLQINTGEEPQKSGVPPAGADAFIKACRDGLALPVRGLMCIPPVEEESSLHFALLGEIARRNGVQDLSMGMSADYETAIRFGATFVRVGTAIFGPRGSRV